MIHTRSMSLYFLLLIGSMIACTEEEDLTANILFQVETTAGSSISIDGFTSTNSLQFDSGTIIIRELGFDGDMPSQSISRNIEQISAIDYATGEVSPPITITVPAGNYTSVYLGIELQDENDDPSVVISGTYTHTNGTAYPIRFEFNSGEVFEASAESVTIDAGEDIVGKVTFDALDWFSVVSASALDNAELTNGVIVISEESNSDIFDIVADRLDVATEAVFQ